MRSLKLSIIGANLIVIALISVMMMGCASINWNTPTGAPDTRSEAKKLCVGVYGLESPYHCSGL